MLKLFGYEQAVINNNVNNTTEKGLRFIYVSSEKSILEGCNIIELKKRFNNRNNRYGEFIQVVIATDTAAEGYSFNHIQREIILFPWWNYSKIEQIIARGIRAGSHKYLTKKDWDKIVKIYLLVSTYKINNVEKSIDLDTYKICKEKDVDMKKIYRIIKENSFDCSLFYNRNNYKKEYKDYLRECDYDVCKLECDVKKECEIEKEPCDGSDKSTYNLYHLQKIEEETIDKIILNKLIDKKNIKYFRY